MAAGAVGKLSEEQPADFFFRFIEDRYGHGDVASLVAHGCIQALEQQAVSALWPLSMWLRHRWSQWRHPSAEQRMVHLLCHKSATMM